MRAVLPAVLALLVLAPQPGCRTPGDASRPGASRNAPSAVHAEKNRAPAARGAVPNPDAPRPPSPLRLTGFEDTAWGMSSDELAAVYPDFPTALATIYGLEATVSMSLSDGRLSSIRVEFDRSFPDMETCGRELERLREELGKELGRSQMDNLSAEWRIEASEVALQCNPGDDELTHANLSVVYQPFER